MFLNLRNIQSFFKRKIFAPCIIGWFGDHDHNIPCWLISFFTDLVVLLFNFLQLFLVLLYNKLTIILKVIASCLQILNFSLWHCFYNWLSVFENFMQGGAIQRSIKARDILLFSSSIIEGEHYENREFYT
jgi:hypothetical protein